MTDFMKLTLETYLALSRDSSDKDSFSINKQQGAKVIASNSFY